MGIEKFAIAKSGCNFSFLEKKNQYSPLLFYIFMVK